jgi:hypothetical protein
MNTTTRYALCLWAALAVAACAGADDGGGDGTDAGLGSGGIGGGTGGAGPGTGGAGPGTGGAGPGAGGSGPAPGGNRRPRLERIGPKEIEAGNLLEIQLRATDEDGDTLFFNTRSDLPPGAKFLKEIGKFSWQPAPDQVGTNALVTFEVTDGLLSDQETVRITVVGQGQGGNRPPEFEAIGDQLLEAGREFTFQVVATDANGDPITYSMRGDIPADASLDQMSGTFRWTPPVAAAGTSVVITFVASDGEFEATLPITLVVRDPNAAGGNRPPVIRPVDNQTVRVGATATLTLMADDENPASLMWSVVGATPANAAFDPATAMFTFTPTADQANQAFRVIFAVSDGEFRVVQPVTFQVEAADQPQPQDCQPDAAEGGADEQLPPNAGVGPRTICPAGDVDRYLVALEAGTAYTITIRFSHAAGDIDANLTGPGGSVVRGNSTNDDEVIQGVAQMGGMYTLEVFSFPRNTGTHPNYSVELSTMQAAVCADDAADNGAGNDDDANAAPLRNFVNQDMQICPGDIDVFSVDLTAGWTVDIGIQFIDAEGDLDLFVRSADGEFRTSSESINDDEMVELDPVPATGRYLVEVRGWRQAENTYRLTLTEMQPAPCDADRLESAGGNDTRDRAPGLMPNLYSNLTLCGDPDWYRIDAAPGSDVRVYVTYDSDVHPTGEMFDQLGRPLADGSFGAAMGDGCRPERAHCRLVRGTVADGDGSVFVRISGGAVGSSYDVRVRVSDQAPALCDANSCPAGQICDFLSGACRSEACGAGCPGGYSCHQNTCRAACGGDGACDNLGFVCKETVPGDLCAPAGQNALGEECTTHAMCAGELDCLDSATYGTTGGSCSKPCAADADCGPNGICGTFNGGTWCAVQCVNDNACRVEDDWHCNPTSHVEGGFRNMCTPGIVI